MLLEGQQLSSTSLALSEATQAGWGPFLAPKKTYMALSKTWHRRSEGHTGVKGPYTFLDRSGMLHAHGHA